METFKKLYFSSFASIEFGLKFYRHFRSKFILRVACQMSLILQFVRFGIVLSWFRVTKFNSWQRWLWNFDWLINAIFIFEFKFVQWLKFQTVARDQPHSLMDRRSQKYKSYIKKIHFHQFTWTKNQKQSEWIFFIFRLRTIS